MRKLTSGVYTYLPYGLAAIRRVEAIVREEMNRAGAQEWVCCALLRLRRSGAAKTRRRWLPCLLKLKLGVAPMPERWCLRECFLVSKPREHCCAVLT